MSSRRLIAVLALALALAVGLSACGGDDESDSTRAALAAIEDGATVIDVRTPEEFAEGHLDGALNIDVQGSEFESMVSELPRDDTYVVYCRTGNRSAAAITRMKELGFTDLINGGGYEDLV